MLSVEYSDKVANRVQFNKPYDLIQVVMLPIEDVIPTLSSDRKHLLWLDYDGIISSSVLSTIVLAFSHLPAGSIVLVTVDIEPPGDPSGRPRKWKGYFEAEASRYLNKSLKLRDFARTNLPGINIGILQNAIKAGLTGRKDAFFQPIFNFVYADGHRMLTIGGMICTEAEQRQVKASKLKSTVYARFDLGKPSCEIRVPNVTRKERLFLESKMPCSEEWTPKDFELSKNDVLSYRDIYRFFPAYAELLL